MGRLYLFIHIVSLRLCWSIPIKFGVWGVWLISCWVIFTFSSYRPNRGTSFSMVPMLRPGGPGFDYRHERRAFRTPQRPYRLGGPPSLSSEYQRPFTSPGGGGSRREKLTVHLHLVINGWSYIYTPPYLFVALCLIRHEGNSVLSCRTEIIPILQELQILLYWISRNVSPSRI